MQTTILIDGGHLRSHAKKLGKEYDAEFINTSARRCADPDMESLWRVLYYDAPHREFKAKLPVSGKTKEFRADNLLEKVAALDLFAVRKGALAFRGWKLRNQHLKDNHPALKRRGLEDEHYKPAFKQKGVDMRIGLDVANIAAKKLMERIVLVSNDTDMIPAMKYARKEGVQVVLAWLSGTKPHRKLVEHCDLLREVKIS